MLLACHIIGALDSSSSVYVHGNLLVEYVISKGIKELFPFGRQA